MPRIRSYSDDELARAVADSHSWRGVLRSLGLSATSSAAIRSVRTHASTLGLDVSHFRGQRTWNEKELREAVASAESWPDVADALGLTGGSALTTIKGHVARLGIAAQHLTPAAPEVAAEQDAPLPSPTHLANSGSLLAAAWFALCGYHVSWPLEPCRYDLLIELNGQTQRIQVKTTTVRAGGSWTVWLSTTGGQRTPYDVQEIDAFFVVDGDLQYYLIPATAVGGLHAIQLSAYAAYRLPGSPIRWP